MGPKYLNYGLTRERGCGINFYTQMPPSTPLLTDCSERKTDACSCRISPQELFECLLLLPLQPKTVRRGVKLNLKAEFVKGKEVTWWSITSTTDNVGVLQNDMFLGSSGNRTMFDIAARSLVPIKKFTACLKRRFSCYPEPFFRLWACWTPATAWSSFR